MDPNKRALLIAPYFLPRRRVGSLRPFRFAIHLQEFGWQPTVVSIAAPGERLTEKEGTLLRNIDVIEIESPLDRTRSSESQLGMEPGEYASGPSRSLVSTLLKKIDRQFPIDTWLPLFIARYKQLTRIVEEVDPHVVWATADPWSSLVVARQLALRYNIPFFADFRDPWTVSELRTRHQWKVSRALDRYFERRVLEDADAVVFPTPLVESMYRRQYGDLNFTSATIPNSYDPVILNDRVDYSAGARRADCRATGLRMGFFGRFRKLSPATLIVDVLRTVSQLDPSCARQMEVHSFGPLTHEDKQYAAERGVLSCFHFQRYIPLERSLSVLRDFDILVLSTERSRTEIIPAKLFEYLAAARPILSLSRNPAVDHILRKTGTGVQITDVGEAAKLLIRCAKARRAGAPLPIPLDPNPEEIAKFEARQTTADLARLFDAVVEPASAHAATVQV